MKKRILSVLVAITSFICLATAQQKTTLTAQINGYQRDMVYFDCVQTPLIAQEFHTNPGEVHIYNFECDNLVYLTINGRTGVILQPGDSLHVDIEYDGKSVRVEYSGSERAVNNNQLMKSIENIKRALRYKSQLLGCVALDIKPKTRINDSRTLQQKVTTLIEKSKASTEAKNYLTAVLDYDVYMSFIEYPVMYSSVRGQAIQEQEIGDYWNIMEGYTTRSDAQSLSSPEYASLLMRYCFYMNEKAARERGEEYKMPQVMEDMFSEFVAFYDGEQRDFVLYTLLRNFIMNGKEIERADALYKKYTEKYNVNKNNKSILDMLLQ
jgi:lipopolysaccharide biosynthesis regulator YciM